MSFKDKDILRIERSLINNKSESQVGLTISEQMILDMITSELGVVTTVADPIYNIQNQLQLVNPLKMVRLVCSCGHHVMARIAGTVIEKVYPCIHCKKLMKGE